MSARVAGTPRNHLVRAANLSVFAHMGEVYLYHDLHGFILKMSPDILELLDAFAEPVDPATVCSRYANAFGEQPPEGFVGVFLQFHCLVEPGADERDSIWSAVAVKGPWNVWERRDDGGLTLYTAWGERPVARHALTPAEAPIWDRLDGETTLDKLAEEHGREAVGDLVARLVHHDVQAVKLSQVPLSFYKGRQHMKPPYLTSTMPYAPYDPAADGPLEPAADVVTPEAYYRQQVADADAQFDHQETTLSHLFRRPHPALGGRTFGQALADAFAARGMVPAAGPVRVLEIGGGLGRVARALTEALLARGLDVRYDILELSPTLAAAQREATAGLPVRVTEGEVLTDPWPGEAFDLIVANEMIGDLPAARLTHEEARLDDDTLAGEAYQAFLAGLGPAGEVIARYDLAIGDAPDPITVNVGAIRLLERVAEHLAPGGWAYLSEFGDMNRWPVLSSHLDHPELSIHFGHLTAAATRLGLSPDLVFLMDLIGLERDRQGLATTRSYFRALQALLADHGVTLEKVGYTREMFEELVGDAVPLDRVGELDFRPIEDRLMGLVPHEFKALLLRQAPAA